MAWGFSSKSSDHLCLGRTAGRKEGVLPQHRRVVLSLRIEVAGTVLFDLVRESGGVLSNVVHVCLSRFHARELVE